MQDKFPTKCKPLDTEFYSPSGASPIQKEPIEPRQSAPVSTLVHPKETTGHLSLPTDYRAFSSQNDKDEMASTEEIYDIIASEDGGKKASAFAWCRSSSWFIVNKETREVRVASRTCKLRWCPMCAKARMRHLGSEVTSWFKDVPNPKFLTLTVQHNEESLYTQVKFLYDCFKQFRKRKLIKDKVSGGVWFFQIHKSEHDGLWHPHLHCVLHSGFIPRKKISAIWQKCTLTSCVTDIRSVKRPDKIAEYVARYAARPGSLIGLNLEDKMELVWSMHGRRLCGKWGTASVISLRPKRPDDCENWKPIGGWSMVRDMLFESDQAKAIVNAWRKGIPLPEDFDIKSLNGENFDLPWEKKALEHEPIQLTFFSCYAMPPPQER